MAKASTTKSSATVSASAAKSGSTAQPTNMPLVATSSVRKWRKSFGRIHEVIGLPNLIEVQKNSYRQFLSTGLHAVLDSVFPIHDNNGRASLEYVSYGLEGVKFDEDECRRRAMTYGAALKVTLRLVVWDHDEDSGVRSIRDIKEQDVYMGEMPMMTERGTFVINGTERVVVSQLHRSPGVFFDHDQGKTHASGKFLYSARVIPYRGSWLDFEFDAKDLLYVRIDRRRKVLATSFLMALDSAQTASLRAEKAQKGQQLGALEVQGMSAEEILSQFYGRVVYTAVQTQKNGADFAWKTAFDPEALKGQKLAFDLVDANTGQLLLEAGNKLNARSGKKLIEEGLSDRLASSEEIIGRYLALDIINEETGEIYAEAGDEITPALFKQLTDLQHPEIITLAIDNVAVGVHIRNTLAADPNRTREEALFSIYRIMRPGEPPTLDTAADLFENLFFNADRYDLSTVGRVKMNLRLGLESDHNLRVLCKDDILALLKVLVDLKDGHGEVDDIDSLANRRVRSVGELMENQYRLGLLRMERQVRDKMSASEIDTLMPQDLINAKPAAATVREFFGSSQLSQFMDQTNPLSEVTHKRRVSALGPGGLTRERAGFEVRDVHPTHYGRICPIETPEGPNIGLINSFATYARVNPYGFIEAPYRRVVDGQVTDQVVYLSAAEEVKHTIAQANAVLDNDNRFATELVSCRAANDFLLARRESIDFIDVSPKQLVSVAAALIPFLENDDANRALMGSNMQRQAVPLLKSEAPLVGTGVEAQVARDSGSTVVARRNGVIDQVDGVRIVVRVDDCDLAADKPGVDIYYMEKFQRSNQSTCINQRPLVRVGDVVKQGDILADGPCTEMGELALGYNALVAFMPWNGYNFEDSILVSEKLVADDVYTSIHIEEFELMSRDTKLGQEEITRDIPNVNEEALRNLDEAGIITIGAEVAAGDILVGKVTPKGESPMTPEEKLLRAIFGEKAADVKDSSLRVPPGITGTVVEVRVFSRRGIDKDERSLAIERSEIERLAKDRDDERKVLERNFFDSLKPLLFDQVVSTGPKGVKAGVKITEDLLATLTPGQWRQLIVKDSAVMDQIESFSKQFDNAVDAVKARFENRVLKLQRGDDLPPGVMKMVKVFLAVKRKIQSGDKMAGRHGNKGVVSRVVPVEDMPFLEDGTPVDIVLNPLGVPSRMNVGQILETHLGWASAGLGKQIRQAYESYQAAAQKAQKADPAAAPTAKAVQPLRDKLVAIYDLNKTDQSAAIVSDLNDKQIVELARNLQKGVPFATPVFDGASQEDIELLLTHSGLDTSGQVQLFDGRSGEAFDRKTTIGYLYMLKLHHLVDDKIHARSVGPYSLVTQQPLGGKAQFGGQRFGEMECWALQAYGAAYTLQEMLTVKSDDVSGRVKVYESIVRGEDNFEAGIPESFHVLVKELRSLGLNIELINSVEQDDDASANALPILPNLSTEEAA
jgi:DNA-directed RNA polymerase subunit beta